MCLASKVCQKWHRYIFLRGINEMALMLQIAVDQTISNINIMLLELLIAQTSVDRRGGQIPISRNILDTGPDPS